MDSPNNAAPVWDWPSSARSSKRTVATNPAIAGEEPGRVVFALHRALAKALEIARSYNLMHGGSDATAALVISSGVLGRRPTVGVPLPGYRTVVLDADDPYVRLARSALPEPDWARPERGELRLFYQPKVDARTRAMTGVEALLRCGAIVAVNYLPTDQRGPLVIQTLSKGHGGNRVYETQVCAMCHVPEQGFTVNELKTSVGMEGVSLRRKVTDNLATVLVTTGAALLLGLRPKSHITC